VQVGGTHTNTGRLHRDPRATLVGLIDPLPARARRMLMAVQRQHLCKSCPGAMQSRGEPTDNLAGFGLDIASVTHVDALFRKSRPLRSVQPPRQSQRFRRARSTEPGSDLAEQDHSRSQWQSLIGVVCPRRLIAGADALFYGGIAAEFTFQTRLKAMMLAQACHCVCVVPDGLPTSRRVPT
jgi:hypothetical protein